MKSSNWRHALIVALLITLLSGCALRLVSRAENAASQIPPKVCSQEPENAVVIFLRGIAEMSLRLLQSVIPDGIEIYSLFEKGKETITELTDHPEIHKGSDVGSVYELISTGVESPGVLRVLIQRIVLITPEENPMEEGREETYQRAFRVFFETSTNCIIRVVSIDTEWEQIK